MQNSTRSSDEHAANRSKYWAAISLVFIGTFLFMAVIVSSPKPVIKPKGEESTRMLAETSPGIGNVLEIVCRHTPFPDTCGKELSALRIPITATPSKLVSSVVQAAMSRVEEGFSLASRWAQEQGLQLLEIQCASLCAELMTDTKQRLAQAVSKLATLQVTDLTSLANYLRDVKVWLSLSLSYQTACSDNFDDAPGPAPAQIDGSQSYIFEVLGNAMSLVNILSEVGDNVGAWLSGVFPPPHLRRRRLLSMNVDDRNRMHEGFPYWVSASERRLLQAPASSYAANSVVAQDGSGNYLNITAAVAAIPQGRQDRYVIYIKTGIYNEVFNVTKDLDKVTLIGDGIGNTVITGDRNVASGEYTTYRTSTVGISGDGFFARDIAFRNTAGAGGHQAVAVRAGADLVVFYRCSFEGYQDTLYALSGRQFYRDCRISGTVDFIFGNAIAIFQNCELIARLPLVNQENTYTAQGRKLSADISGFSFQNCTLTGDADLLNASSSSPTYLGRPWKAYSRVVFIRSEMQSLVQPAGWLPWNSSNPFTDTLYYGEYQNRGAGAGTAARVNWTGVHPNITDVEATQFTFQSFVSTGENWVAPLQVAYQGSL